ncbi:MAG: alpha/beta fold hydrolase [Pyrinomonadaceae bacterium]
MKPERWQQIKPVLQSALKHEPGERSAFLDAACGGDESLRKEVESFIISHEQAGGFIEEPAFEVMAESLVNKQTELVGQKLGHYLVLEHLGAGGMGDVYLAEDTRLARKVALKMLPADLTAEDERVRRFQQEARAASALNHPNIITIYEIAEINSRHFMATEFIDGQTLFDYLRAGLMKLDDALNVAMQVTSALCAAHQAGIVHRDIKPGNIMLRTDGIVKVLDFGLAMLTEQKDDGLEAATLVKTKQGTVMGTAHYMSPEQARGQKMDARTDIFSLGVVLYEMLTGRVPFGGQTMTDVLASILMLEPPSLSQSAPATPEELQRIVHHALRKDKAERYQSAAELLNDLKDLKQDLEFETRSRGLFSSGSRSGVAVSVRPRPETRYAKSGDVNIAYQVVGNGPVDLVYVMGWVTNLDYFWEEPSYARFLNRLASFSRLILFDKRGTGLSDRVHESALPTLEQRMDDVRAVMDAVGSERAALFGVSEGGPMAALFAATYPERTSALVMYGSYAKRIWDPAYPWAPTPDERQKFFDLIQQGWGGVVDATIMAPTRAADERFKDWWATFLRRSASPGAALAFAKMNTQIDITKILPTISVPTLIVHRAGDLDANVGGARYMARQIPGAKYVELPGEDHLPFIGNQEAVLDEIERFLDGIRHVPVVDRVLATVLCLNVIGSTNATQLRENDLQDSFLSLTKRELERFRGREVENSEHTILAGFDGPARAVHAACSIRDSARRLGIEIRAGLHTGECDTINDKLAGIAVEMSTQIAAKARAREVLVSSTVKDLVAGSGIQFEDRGARLLKGVQGKWRLFAVVRDGEFAGIKQAGKPKSRRGHKTIDSLAILPLQNASADPDMEYFSDGITESIINTLSQLPKLRVVARSTVFRYKGREVDLQEVGQQLDVRAVLTGRVQKLGDELMIAAELIDVTNDAHLWGERFNRKMSEIFAVQDEIAREITATLRIKLTGEQKRRLEKRFTENPKAYHAYLKGRHYWNKRATAELKKGVEHFRQAIDIDPSYASAYAGLSDSYTLLVVREAISSQEGFAKARAAAEMALRIDGDLSQAHASLGHALLHHWEWEPAEKELKRAIELNSGYPSAHHWYSEHLTAMGRCSESIAELKLAGELDPLSLIISADLGRAFYFARQYDEVIKQEARTLEMDSNFWLSHINLGKAYTQTEKHGEAIRELQKAYELSVSNTEALSFLGFAYAAAGRTDDALQALEELTKRSKHNHVPPYHFAVIHAGLGNNTEAFAWLERAFETRAVDLFTLTVEPVLDSLRSDPRFTELQGRIGLPRSESFASTALLKRRARSSRTPAPAKRASHKALSSLAILPFVNTNADPNMEYLSDGITESIINSLSQLPELRVVARNTVFRYKGQDIELQELGRLMGVSAIVTGRVRQAGDNLNVAAELVDLETDSQRWGENYQRKLSDVFEIQSQIAREIAEQLRLKLGGPAEGKLLRRHTNNVDAYHAYLRGRHLWNKRTAESVRQSVEYFKQSIDMDPSYALALAGLADSYVILGSFGISALPPKDALPKARKAAVRALEIDDSLAEAHASLAYTLAEYYWDWDGAEKEFKRAIELKPDYAMAHHWYGFVYLVAMGLLDEAVAEIKRAHELDPLSLTISANLGSMFYLNGQYDEAIDQCLKTLELDQNFIYTHWHMAMAYEAKGSYEQAIAEFRKSVDLSGGSSETKALLAHAYAVSGNRTEALNILAELTVSASQKYVSAYRVAIIHAGLGDLEQSFSWLERAYEERDGWLIWLKIDPALELLRLDERFTALLRRVGLINGAQPVESFNADTGSGVAPTSRMSATRKRPSRKAITSIAVLPLVNTGNDPNTEYLSDGITESIINSLSQLPKLKVMARSTVFRYKDRQTDPQQAGHDLGVQAVLTGRVQQIGERLIIGTELVDVNDGSQLWGEQQHRAIADIFELQEEISGQISTALQLKVSGVQKKRLKKRPTKDTQAYNLYLKGRFFWNKRTEEDANRGIRCFQQSLSLDPNFALAYAGLADCQILLGDVGVQAISPKEAFLQGQQSASRALDLDDTLAEAHGTLGHVSMHLFDWPRAQSELRRALELNPNYAQAYVWQAYYLSFTGQFEDAIASINCALQLDPLALPVNTSAAELLFFAGRFDESIDQFQKSIELDEQRSLAHLELARVYEHQEMYDAAIDEFAKARELSDGSPESFASLAHCYAVSGATTEAQDLLRQLTEMSESRYVSSYDMALIQSGLGETEECFEWLNRAYEVRDGWMIYITVDPRWQSLRSDPRFCRIVQSVGLAPP